MSKDAFRHVEAMLRQLEKNIEAEFKKAIAASALIIQSDIKRSMHAPKHGRTYRRGSIGRFKNGYKVDSRGRFLAGGRGNKFHRASAAGEPPAVDTGRLVASINHRLSADRLTAYVGIQDVSLVKYAKFLEYGTRTMSARPWLTPAIERNRKIVLNRIDQGIKRAIARTQKGSAV